VAENEPAATPGGIEIISMLTPEQVLDRCVSVAEETRGTGMQAQKARVRVNARSDGRVDLYIGTESTAGMEITAVAEAHPSGSRLDCRMTTWKSIQQKVLFIPLGKPMIVGAGLFLIYLQNLQASVQATDPAAIITIDRP
jgi:hypothetical protein